MATINPFDLLGDDDSEDPSLLIAAQQLKIELKKSQAPSAKPTPSVGKAAAQPKLPSKPLPPAQAVRESKSEPSRGGRGIGRGFRRGRGAGGGSHRDSTNTENSYVNREVSTVRGAAIGTDGDKFSERREGYGGSRGPFRGGHQRGFNNGEVGEGERDRPRRPFERHSGTGRGNDMKREGSGIGNWGTPSDELAPVSEEFVNEDGKSLKAEKPGDEKVATDGDKEAATKEVEEKEPEEKEMTLEEYAKVLEEKRKALQALKTEERKVDVKEFESMQPLANKKNNDDIFVKLGTDKDKKKELAEKEEKSKKSVSINEFLKPAEGDRFYSGGRGRGRGGGGSRGGYSGGSEMGNNYKAAPSIEDPGQFPTLGGK